MRYQGPMFSELGQDQFVLETLEEKTKGWFVEVGAMDGKTYSNTYLMEQLYGWTGIVAECNPRFWPDLVKNRRCLIDDRAVYDLSGLQLDFVCLNHGYSGLAHAGVRYDHSMIQVPSVSLNDLLAQHHAPDQIDYISLDTEGSELTILQGFDWARWQVSIWTVEHNHREPACSAIRSIMQDRGYRRVLEEKSQYDDWFVHESVLQ